MSTLILFATLLVGGKIAGALVERYRMPSVVGEILFGAILALISSLFWPSFLENMRHDHGLEILAELGIILLLFGAGLETSPKEMMQVGLPALLVAMIGVVAPVAVAVGYMLLMSGEFNLALFVGATLAATSVGITASVFGSAKLSQLQGAKIVLGAAVIDDILGILLLSIVAGIVRTGTISAMELFTTVVKSFGFLATAMFLGPYLAAWVSRTLSRISPGHGMKSGTLIGFAIFVGWLATLVGLEGIIGAFAAGLVLESAHFSYFYFHELSWKLRKDHWNELPAAAKELVERHDHHDVAEITAQFVGVFATVFFVLVGTKIDVLGFTPGMIIPLIVLVLIAISGKIVAGVAAPGSRLEKLFVGLSMVPRGEVGLVFAATGSALGVITPEWLTILVIVVLLSTIIPLAPIAQVGKKLKEVTSI